MTEYEILDSIADLYNPTLFGLSIFYSVSIFTKGYRFTWVKGVFALAIAYAGMFIDKHYLIFESYGADYSTHSTVAFSMILYLGHRQPLFSLKSNVLIFSLIAYYILEIYQKYHTLTDILSSVLVVLPFLLLVFYFFEKLSAAVWTRSSISS